MKVAEILRKLADMIDSAQDPARPGIQNSAEMSAASAGLPVSAPDNKDAGEGDAVMLPPLQLKTELLKKAVGVDSVFDAGEPCADRAHDNQPDELDDIKRIAGVPVVAISELSDDEPLES